MTGVESALSRLRTVRTSEVERHAFTYGDNHFFMANITSLMADIETLMVTIKRPMVNIAPPMAKIKTRMAEIISTLWQQFILVWRKLYRERFRMTSADA